MSHRVSTNLTKSWLAAVIGCFFSFQACGEDPNVVGPLPDASTPATDAPTSATGCTPNAAECLNDRVGRICPSDGSSFLSFECRAGETCSNGACAGGCTAGTVECDGDRIARVCGGDGEAFVVVPCGTGEICEEGRCVAEQACTPGTVECATEHTARTCDAEGASWILEPCAEGDICTDSGCERDVDGAECTPNARECVSATVGLRCLPEGRGFEQFECPEDAPCTNGVCLGSVCVLGESSCGFTNDRDTIRTCADGTSLSETICPLGSRCVTSSSTGITTARCSSSMCQFGGQRMCGDPTDPAGIDNSFYSECQFTQDGQQWVRVDCPPPATCDPSSIRCDVDCVPGEKRCDGNAFQECTADGAWGPSAACSTGTCEQVLGGDLPDVRCVDPLCAAVRANPGSGIGGACDGARVRPCNEDGTLSATAEDCDDGICRALSPGFTINGAVPGRCSSECQDGEERCVQDGLPLYQVCDNGTFSPEYLSCNTACVTVMGTDGLSSKLCGGECTPGSTRCSGENLQTCGQDGQWLVAQPCSVGRCSSQPSTAACIADCVPGSSLCVGEGKTASDGIHTGLSQAATCTAQGLVSATPTDCPGTTTCRVSGSGATVGCVECIGANVPGGNTGGLSDSRCAAQDSVQVCGTNNDWQSSTSCGASGACFIGTSSACTGQCIGGFSPCTESALLDATGGTCQEFGLGAPRTCGTTPDCCTDACASGGDPFAFCAPEDFSPCLGGTAVTDIPSTLPQALTGSTFFSDDSFAPGCVFGGGADEVFRFTAPSTGMYAFDTAGSSFDTALYLLDPLSCGELACNDDFGTLQSRVQVDLSAGQQILVIVDGLGGSGGNFTLNVFDPSVQCSPFEFRCSDGGCIPSFARCDLQVHCMDGSDEAGCGDGGNGCGNGTIQGFEQCDGDNLDGESCATVTMGARPNGTLLCSPVCTFNTANCFGLGQDGGGGFGAFGPL